MVSSSLLVALFVSFVALSSAAGSTKQCQPGFFLRRNACQKCPKGTYSWGGNFNSCINCPAGTYTPYKGVVDESLCLPCPSGTSSTPGSPTCHPLRRSSSSSIPLPPRTRCGTFYIPPPSGVSYFPTSVCVSPITGCPRGLTLFTWARRAVCMRKQSGKVVCPQGYVFDSVDRCVKCQTGSKLVKVPAGTDDEGFKIRTARCERCSGNAASKGGLRQKCVQCGCGFARSADGATCMRTVPEGVDIQC